MNIHYTKYILEWTASFAIIVCALVFISGCFKRRCVSIKYKENMAKSDAAEDPFIRSASGKINIHYLDIYYAF